MRPLRIGHQLTGNSDESRVDRARRAEELGFDIVLMSDHVGPGLAPLPTLAAIASATEVIRLGTFVLNNDMRNPVQLAWESVTVDRLSDGRFELGLGAGHTPQEYGATGIAKVSSPARKARLRESVEIIRALVDGECVDHHGEHYDVDGAQIDRSTQEHMPILIGGNGAALLGHAGAHADIIGLQGLGKTLDDGHRHEVKWSTQRLGEQIEQIRLGAGDRHASLELNALVQVVQITDDRDGALEKICERVDGLTLDDARVTPYLAVGSVDQIVAHLHGCNERWGISYVVVRELDAFEPVLRALR